MSAEAAHAGACMPRPLRASRNANDSSVSCHVHDDNKANNLLVPGLREYEVLHPESVFVGARP